MARREAPVSHPAQHIRHRDQAGRYKPAPGRGKKASPARLDKALVPAEPDGPTLKPRA